MAGKVQIGDTIHRPIMRDGTFAATASCTLRSVAFSKFFTLVGFDDEDRDVLSFIPGTPPNDPRRYGDNQPAAAVSMLRCFNGATSGKQTDREQHFEVACHDHWSPTNAIFVEGKPAVMIDLDATRPGERFGNLGYSAFAWLVPQ